MEAGCKGKGRRVNRMEIFCTQYVNGSIRPVETATRNGGKEKNKGE
jgi:hypothetical protein